jgi:hypothetical protein
MVEPATGSGSFGGTGAGAAEPSEEGSSFQNLIRALISPSEAFASLARRPRFLVALLAVALVSTAFVYIAMSRIDPDEMVRAIESQGRQLPPEMHDNPERLAAISLWSATAWTPIAFSGILLLWSLLYLIAFRMLGSEIDFRRSAATAVHGSLPLVVAALVGLAVVLGRGEVGFLELQSNAIVTSNLAFLAGDETSKPMRALLSSFDLFAAWSVALSALGFHIVARVSKASAWTVVLILWGLGTVLKVGLAAAF